MFANTTIDKSHNTVYIFELLPEEGNRLWPKHVGVQNIYSNNCTTIKRQFKNI
jgi:hypothetical protein